MRFGFLAVAKTNKGSYSECFSSIIKFVIKFIANKVFWDILVFIELASSNKLHFFRIVKPTKIIDVLEGASRLAGHLVHRLSPQVSLKPSTLAWYIFLTFIYLPRFLQSVYKQFMDSDYDKGFFNTFHIMIVTNLSICNVVDPRMVYDHRCGGGPHF